MSIPSCMRHNPARQRYPNGLATGPLPLLALRLGAGVGLGNLRWRGRLGLARRRVWLRDLGRARWVQLARRRIRLRDVRLLRWVEIAHAAPFGRLECA